MRKLTRSLSRGVLACTMAWALLGCDAQRIEKLEEGVATEADVRKQFGEPAGVRSSPTDRARWSTRDSPRVGPTTSSPSAPMAR